MRRPPNTDQALPARRPTGRRSDLLLRKCNSRQAFSIADALNAGLASCRYAAATSAATRRRQFSNQHGAGTQTEIAAMSANLVIVSADSHTGGAPEAYREYLETQFRPELDALAVENQQFIARGITQERYSAGQMDLIDERRAIRDGGLMGVWDASRRVKEMDGEGIAAEILIPGHQMATLPFFGIINRPAPAPLRAAGARAYHRWLADLLAQSNGRLYGVADAGPCLDMQETVRELRWVAQHGFVSVQPPGFTADPALPPLTDDYYEPFWGACAELGLVITIHVGYGVPQVDQATFMMVNRAGLPPIGEVAEEERVVHRRQKDTGLLNKVFYAARRVAWQMMASGALDRHPELKLVFTECRADWVPATLDYLDRQFESGAVPLKMRPSEYWQRHFYVTPSSPRDYEVAMRGKIGVNRWLFGTDYPHPEGTWPNSLDWIRTAFAGVPEVDARRMLGENAIECYNLDRKALTAVAQSIGPAAEDILGGRRSVPPALIADFDKRAGYAQPMEQVDTATLGQLLRADFSPAAAT
jgi:predicted TIM-barrel fold metal-dependent hydrolase